jgi:hypothetical protein
MFSQCRQIIGCSNLIAEFAHGTRGVAEMNGSGSRLHIPGQKSWRSPRERGKQGPYQKEHDVFFAAIRNNKPHSEIEYGALSTMTAILGRMATYSGKIVTWDEAFNSDATLTTDAESWDSSTPIKPDDEERYAVAIPGVTKAV